MGACAFVYDCEYMCCDTLCLLYVLCCCRCVIGFVFFLEVTSLKVHSYRLRDDQIELLDRICKYFHISRSFFIRQLIDCHSSDLFERLNSSQVTNEPDSITSTQNEQLFRSLAKPQRSLGTTYTKKPRK